MQEELSTVQSSQGSFQADRERDILSAALGNKEHPGRTRGIGLYVDWNKGFSKDSETYRSRKRAKAEREAVAREEMRASLREELRDFIREEIRASLTNQLEAPAATVLASPPKRPSSCASNHNLEIDNRFPVDDILVIIIIPGMLNPLIGLLE